MSFCLSVLGLFHLTNYILVHPHPTTYIVLYNASLCSPSWPKIHGDLPTPVSQVLELQVYATTSSEYCYKEEYFLCKRLTSISPFKDFLYLFMSLDTDDVSMLWLLINHAAMKLGVRMALWHTDFISCGSVSRLLGLIIVLFNVLNFFVFILFFLRNFILLSTMAGDCTIQLQAMPRIFLAQLPLSDLYALGLASFFSFEPTGRACSRSSLYLSSESIILDNEMANLGAWMCSTMWHEVCAAVPWRTVLDNYL